MAQSQEADTDMSLWTETPAQVSRSGNDLSSTVSLLFLNYNSISLFIQKLERLKNGKRKAKADAEEEDAVRRKKMRDAEIRSTIDQHNVSFEDAVATSNSTSKVHMRLSGHTIIYRRVTGFHQ